ncbi:MAG: hypothetical protein LLG93_07665 [Deltaproteobacteria bacterium]|nr:hypothetical protein [Deltaproteobacteria bacterium]
MNSILLQGYEEALASHIAAGFLFSSPNNQTLVGGRNVFVQGMPEVEEQKQAYPTFDIANEPTLGIFSEVGEGFANSVGRGGRGEWRIRLTVRCGAVPERAKQLCEELTEYLVRPTSPARGAVMGAFITKGIFLVSRPDLFTVAGDGHAYASAVLRFLAVVRLR